MVGLNGIVNWEIVTGCERLTPGCDSCPSYWEYKENGWDYSARYRPENLSIPEKEIQPRVYSVAFGSDLFHEAVTPENIQDVFKMINLSYQHIFEIGTKRIERCLSVTEREGVEWTDNVSLGVTIEEGKYKWRIDYLKQTKAKLKFIAIVPILGPIGDLDLSGIQMVGVMQETWGPKRPAKLEWINEVREQCKEQGVKFTLDRGLIYSSGELECKAMGVK